jgi:hypothetical protein
LPLQPLYALARPFAFVGLGFSAVQTLAADSFPGDGRTALHRVRWGSSNTQSVHQPQSYTVQVTASSDTLTKTMHFPERAVNIQLVVEKMRNHVAHSLADLSD